MGNKKSLRYLISKYAVIEVIYTGFIVLLFLVGLNFLINRELVYPANYADKGTVQVEAGFQSDDWVTDDIPFYYDFLYMENGKIVENTIDKKYDDKVRETLKTGRAFGGEFVGSSIFKLYTKDSKQLVLKYKMSIIPVSEKIYRLFSNFELLYTIFMLLLWFLGFVLLLIRYSNLLKKEINKIAIANDNITKMDLDYKRDYSAYKEIDGVLCSIDVLAKNLKKTLGEMWEMQAKQKEMVEQLTHDIRTPITLIKGNMELLSEESPDLPAERFSDISNGIVRLETYIEKLKTFSYNMVGKKDLVSSEVIAYWIELMSGICRSKGLNLEVVQNDSSNICLDKEEVATVLQNIVSNAVEHAKNCSQLTVSFCDENAEFIIIVRDDGAGFDEGLLPQLTEKFVSGKTKDSDYKHGLGLWTVKNIVMSNNGKLYLRNYREDGTGAEVKIVFSKGE